MSAQQAVYQIGTQVENADEGSEDLIVEAKGMGWKPEDEFKGDPDKWISAKDYVEFGRKAIPILQANNKHWQQTTQQLSAKVDALTKQLGAAQNDFKTLQEFHNEDIVQRTKEARAEIIAQLKVAKRDNDTDLEVDLTDKLTQLTQAQQEAESSVGKSVDEVQEQQEQVQYNPAMVAWAEKHKSWFGIDAVRSNQAIGIGHLVRADRPDLLGEAFYAEVDRRMAKMNSQGDRSAGKVANGSTGTSVKTNSGRTYADLPVEGKAICDKYAKKFVNANGQFKTTADYQKHYVKQLEETGYFNDNGSR